MKLTFIEKKDIPGRFEYKSTKILDLLKEFTESDATAARVDDHEYKSSTSAAATINASAKRFGMTGIKAISRNNKTYLIKEV